MSVRIAIAALAATTMLAAPAAAAQITTLFSTGVDAAGAVTTGNGADLHWTVNGGTAFTGGTNGVYPIGPWIAEDSVSRWLTPTTSAGDNNAAGVYTYTTTFSLAGLNAATASISGSYAVDDSLTGVTLNGTPLAIAGVGFTDFKNFTIASGAFVAGLNTLSFVTENGGGPSGFRVALSGQADAVAPVPEPASWAMMIGGMGLAGGALRRRRAKVSTTVAFA